MYRIRLHGRGGQGIKTASRILGTALFRRGYEVQDAPVYGAERRGAPMFAHVRAAREPIRERGLVTRPDLVAVADATLLQAAAASVLLGLSERTVLLIVSDERPDVWRARLGTQARTQIIPPLETPQPSLGALAAGAAARLLGVIDREALADASREELGRVDPALLSGFDFSREQTEIVSEGMPISAIGYAPPAWIELRAEPAQSAAPDIRARQSSLLSNTGAWRTMRPVIDPGLCNRCVWVCGTLCPDSAIAADGSGAPRIDYEHCKGCLVCVAVCPPHAIRAVPEREAAESAA